MSKDRKYEKDAVSVSRVASAIPGLYDSNLRQQLLQLPSDYIYKYTYTRPTMAIRGEKIEILMNLLASNPINDDIFSGILAFVDSYKRNPKRFLLNNRKPATHKTKKRKYTKKKSPARAKEKSLNVKFTTASADQALKDFASKTPAPAPWNYRSPPVFMDMDKVSHVKNFSPYGTLAISAFIVGVVIYLMATR